MALLLRERFRNPRLRVQHEDQRFHSIANWRAGCEQKLAPLSIGRARMASAQRRFEALAEVAAGAAKSLRPHRRESAAFAINYGSGLEVLDERARVKAAFDLRWIQF
jgi:hypothetical protein